MLTQRHRISLRRHLGVPFAATGQAGRLFGWRFAIHNEDLEYKLSNLAPNEEQLIVGNSMGSLRIDGPIAVSDVLSFSITDPNPLIPVMAGTYTVKASDLNPVPNPVNPPEMAPSFQVAGGVALALNAVAITHGYAAVAAMPADLFNTQYFSPYFSQVLITGPGASLFALACSSVGRTNFIVNEPPTLSPIRAIINGVTVYGYTDLLDALAMQPARADVSLWVAGGKQGTLRPDELRARNQLYRYYCQLLSRDLGGKEYVEHFFGGSGGGSIA